MGGAARDAARERRRHERARLRPARGARIATGGVGRRRPALGREARAERSSRSGSTAAAVATAVVLAGRPARRLGRRRRTRPASGTSAPAGSSTSCARRGRSRTRASAPTDGSWSPRARTAPRACGGSRTARRSARSPSSAPVRLARFSPDGTLVAVASDDGAVALWRVADGSEAARRCAPAARSGTWRSLPTAATLATASGGSARSGRSPTAACCTHSPARRQGAGRRVLARRAPARDGRAARDGHGSGTSQSGRALHVLRGHRPALARHRRRLHARRQGAAHDGLGHRRPHSGPCRSGAPLQTPARPVRRPDYGRLQPRRPLDRDRRPDHRRALAGRRRASCSSTSAGHTDQLTTVSFSPDGRQVLTASKDGSVRTYDCHVCADLAGLERLAAERLRQSSSG